MDDRSERDDLVDAMASLTFLRAALEKVRSLSERPTKMVTADDAEALEWCIWRIADSMVEMMDPENLDQVRLMPEELQTRGLIHILANRCESEKDRLNRNTSYACWERPDLIAQLLADETIVSPDAAADWVEFRVKQERQSKKKKTRVPMPRIVTARELYELGNGKDTVH